ncbi:Sir2 family NAD-dependent protein deacetylase [Gilvimarinus sp. SDUM040013]|uniref:protein acetyllysine N-acetyltransferase n=1 Tax=Gilvimarinus gilvus TaxID=3058038 RepID=A0ABU4RVI4_9GAMM|nr:Sir2 family NAD-dependent protein deacetylase [Gilvimarinus sp. SDUM040013]MDO3387955.1 Sir2 family NAD-dependent protein deacetylase [Gilvimarinus sp. SDUM040013]MDX6848674.1 Sir2 family NAD-dependent protein deacetylase [Gilvimarinus sp. SDUM040013]
MFKSLKHIWPEPTIMPEALSQAASLIHSADSLVICAGAGMGVDSGLPDFRGNSGFWKAYPRLAAQGVRFAEIANPSAFLEHPELAWEFYAHRINLYRSAQPHLGFGILKRWCDEKPGGGFVYTSNVDGHFQKAGFADSRVLECHGSLAYLQCTEPCGNHLWPMPDAIDPKQPPLCPKCDELARPNVLMFNDWGAIHERAEQKHEAFERWSAIVSNPIVIELGAGVNIPSVRRFAATLEVPIVRINPQDHRISRPHAGLAFGALKGLTALQEVLESSVVAQP